MNFPKVFPDIKPIPQDDGPHPVCAIDYPDKFVEAMDYLRALIDIDEHSGRLYTLLYVLSHEFFNNNSTYLYSSLTLMLRS